MRERLKSDYFTFSLQSCHNRKFDPSDRSHRIEYFAPPMVEWLKLLACALSLPFKSRARLEAENLVLHQQLNVIIRKLPKRLRLTNSDRLVLLWLYRRMEGKSRKPRRCQRSTVSVLTIRIALHFERTIPRNSLPPQGLWPASVHGPFFCAGRGL
jgi:hypothetical protein